MRKLIPALLVLAIAASCNRANDYQKVIHDPNLYSRLTGQLTEIMTFNIFTPPVASRVYAYSHLAAYEVMAKGDSNYTSLDGQLKGLVNMPKPQAGKQIDYPYASMVAMLEVGKTLTFSNATMDSIVNALKETALDHGMPDSMESHSKAYGLNVAKAVLAWSKKDNYAQTRSAAKYTVPEEEGKWIPTPPAYIQAVEPHWRTIRSIVMDSASQFAPPPPAAFSKDSTSEFYGWAKQVYDTVNNLSDEQKAIASFWDCNGFKVNVVGHAMFATKAMTPGGHWMGIIGIVCKDKQVDFSKTIQTYTLVSFALMDAFISCWDAKYTWALIRPESVINQYIDASWKPFLQTPPFPEYTSGHSEISSAAATVLEHLYGTNVSFRDSTERAWGWPDRNFTSLRQAADEAGISRFYGGIHYRQSIAVAKDQGLRLGNHVMTKLQTSKHAEKLAAE
ncbi:vanadium-dependent haloperoxidase [Paraflavitalea sp. CAU 1676]|uniref:vanadium-dependent haloperoxidase n=1 Tax=Paraflavitalea sp. CAU 1676 TaxID=3032598 RepID=UPI0023DC20A5|nr:vanadium-dependent haloperoxidase [Paraflavitalea sp. CAU 1676]MDF2187015.1 vanadium-dependent haloperoxidase [Paraflavitalea sp. CAU 1676]